jgi:hypothetical protein
MRLAKSRNAGGLGFFEGEDSEAEMTGKAKCSAVYGLAGLFVLSGFAPEDAFGQRPSDFLFESPNAALSIHLGYGVPGAGSDIFQDIDTIFTLGMSDFNAMVIGGSLAFFLNDRLDLSFELGYTGSEVWSEYVDFVELLEDGTELPIEQQTKFTRVPITASVRYFLMSRGRQIGSFSWIPEKWAPYLGLGGGWTYYEFEQVGDFVDFVDSSIFTASFASDGWALTGHALGGVQYSISPRWVMTAEGRYSWASEDLDRPQFQGYDPIDLSGFQGTLGFGVRF